MQVSEKGFLKEQKKEKVDNSNLINNSSSTESSQVHIISLKYLLHVASMMISEREQPVLRTRHWP